ncbi:MAG: hypothetical protein HY791_19975 [Deltaproteobacteria bacterium]|nr:hypothetical protein [Deltaproteobacteria bacterium]
MRSLPFVTLFFVAACESSLDQTDARVDASVRDIGDTSGFEPDAGAMDAAHPDAAHPDAALLDADTPDAMDGSIRDAANPDAVSGGFDGNELRDATPLVGSGDESVRGTTLEGIAIEWTAPLELCTRWQEGRPIAGELDAKARLTLVPEPRLSLGSGHLSQATLTKVVAKRGPLSTQQWALDRISSALVSYRVTPQAGGATSLTAELEHDLGPAGVLVESLGVYRSPGDVRPVRVGQWDYEHTFAIRRAPIGEAALLEPCQGPDQLDDAVFVLSAERAGERVILTRYARTTVAFAGSAPVVLRGLDVRWPDPFEPVVSVRDFWGMTYAAEHHNWNDSSHFDFASDLIGFETLFEPFVRGEPVPFERAVETVDLRGIDGFDGTPEVELGWRDFQTGSLDRETYVAGRNWIRVDSVMLRNGLTCAGGDVITLSDYNAHTFQVLTCPRAASPGFRIEAIVLVHFPEEAASTGQTIASPTELLVSGRPSFRFVVGRHDVTISRGSEAYYFLTVREGGQVISESLSEPSDLWPTARDEQLRFSSANGSVSIEFVRRWAAIGVGESSIFVPVYFDATLGARSWHVEAWDRLDYTNTHHNWLDTFVARADDVTIEWETEFFPEQHDRVRIVDSAGAELLPETEVFAR